MELRSFIRNPEQEQTLPPKAKEHEGGSVCWISLQNLQCQQGLPVNELLSETVL
jgi:hypothetical protein